MYSVHFSYTWIQYFGKLERKSITIEVRIASVFTFIHRFKRRSFHNDIEANHKNHKQWIHDMHMKLGLFIGLFDI